MEFPISCFLDWSDILVFLHFNVSRRTFDEFINHLVLVSSICMSNRDLFNGNNEK